MSFTISYHHMSTIRCHPAISTVSVVMWKRMVVSSWFLHCSCSRALVNMVIPSIPYGFYNLHNVCDTALSSYLFVWHYIHPSYHQYLSRLGHLFYSGYSVLFRINTKLCSISILVSLTIYWFNLWRTSWLANHVWAKCFDHIFRAQPSDVRLN